MNTYRTDSGGWAYVSLVSALPGVTPDPRLALAVQFLCFEGVAIGLAAWYERWGALPFATSAILVATLGSGLMVVLSERVLELDPPDPYRRILFESSLDVVMGLIAFIALLSHLLANGQGALLRRLLGDPLPAPAVFFALFLAWDLSYRIGTAWLASITGFWRSISFGRALEPAARRAYVRTDLLTMSFAGLQLLLVPLLWPDRVLAGLVVGHVVAVALVSSVAIGLQFRS